MGSCMAIWNNKPTLNRPMPPQLKEPSQSTTQHCSKGLATFRVGHLSAEWANTVYVALPPPLRNHMLSLHTETPPCISVYPAVYRWCDFVHNIPLRERWQVCVNGQRSSAITCPRPRGNTSHKTCVPVYMYMHLTVRDNAHRTRGVTKCSNPHVYSWQHTMQLFSVEERSNTHTRGDSYKEMLTNLIIRTKVRADDH